MAGVHGEVALEANVAVQVADHRAFKAGAPVEIAGGAADIRAQVDEESAASFGRVAAKKLELRIRSRFRALPRKPSGPDGGEECCKNDWSHEQSYGWREESRSESVRVGATDDGRPQQALNGGGTG